MKINYEAKTIELTKAENKAASTFGSEMYKVLREARQDNPSFTVVVSKRTHNGKYKGLDYDYNEANKNMMPTYQRLIKKKRLLDVQRFINDGGYFPNSLIISIFPFNPCILSDFLRLILDFKDVCGIIN